MSPEQEPALVSPSAPARRRIVVAPKQADKPLALIVRDPEIQAEFETQLSGARRVVIFPSLTHLCTDPLRTAWAGVVVARPCGFDVRLANMVPDQCIAFWRVAEEGYGWPSGVSHLSNQEDLSRWLEDIKNPRPITRIVTPKRAPKPRATADVSKASSNSASKGQLKFELAVPRGTVQVERKAESAAPPAQMELAELHINGSSAGYTAAQSAAAEAGHAKSTTPSKLPTPKRGKAASKKKVEQLALPAVTRNENSQEQREALKHAVLSMPAKSNTQKEALLYRVAAELGLTRAEELLEQLRKRAKNFR